MAESSRRQVAAEIAKRGRTGERLRSLLVIAPAVLLGLFIIGSVSFYLVQTDQESERVERAAGAEIEGVTSIPDLPRNHVQGDVDYLQSPPAGGDHAAIWMNCGVYTAPVDNEQAVHSLEHGAVWITYQPDLPQDQVDQLAWYAESNGFVLLSPVEGLDSPIVASAWGKQLELSSANDERLGVFVTKYVRGPQTPEPGAPCTGGIGEG